MKKTLWLALVMILLGLNLLTRLLWIRADAPISLPNNFSIQDGFRDEAEKSHEARNWALFHEWKTSPADEFQFWIKQSPAWVYPLGLYFRILGVGYLQLRLFSVFFSLLSLGFLTFWAWKRGGPVPAIFMLIGLGLNFYFLLYSRIGLIEGMMNAWMVFAVFLFARSKDRPGLFLTAGILYLLSIFSKQSTLFFMPAFLLLGFYLLAGTNKGRPRRALLILLGLALVLGAVAVAMSSPEYRLRTLYNVRHGLQYHRAATSWLMQLDPGYTLSNIISTFSPSALWEGFFGLHPSIALLGLAEIAAIIFMAVRRRKLDFELALILVWFVLARVYAIISPHRAVRFYLAEFYPLALLGSEFAGVYWKNKWGRAAVILAVLIELGFSGYYYSNWLANRQYQLHDNSALLAKALSGQDAVLIGELAGPFAMESRAKFYYVKRGFNQRPEQFRAFGINYLLETSNHYDVSVGRYKELFPENCAKRKPVAQFLIYDRLVNLYQIPILGP
jgi:4-amino-4-deoxy-L-arabinose transferase-like glycosyltransferase